MIASRPPRRSGLALALLALAGCPVPNYQFTLMRDAGPDQLAGDAVGETDARGARPPCDASVCAGRCVDTNVDPSNCGACGLACEAPVNGRAGCRARACDFACDAPYARLGAGCVLVAPACSDGVDNDDDGRTDFGVGALNDPGCASASDGDEHWTLEEFGTIECDDGADNDSDGRTDFHRSC